jgi:hypothetical protein
MNTKDLRLTPELQKKLSGFLGFSIDANFQYTFKVYRENNVPKDLWPLFTLKSLDGLEVAQREDKAGFTSLDQESGQVQLHIGSGSKRIATLESGIVAIKNFILEDGSTLSFDKESGKITILAQKNGKQSSVVGTVSDIIKYLPAAAQLELQEAINEHSSLSEEELQGLEF